MICAAFPGWTIEYVESILDAPQLNRFVRHLKRDPATHSLVKWFVGYEPPEDEPESEDARLESFVTAFQSAIR